MDLNQILFDVSVILGSADFSHQAYQALQIGDILILKETVEEPLLAKVGSTDYFFATAGLYETHKAVVIDERIHA